MLCSNVVNARISQKKNLGTPFVRNKKKPTGDPTSSRRWCPWVAAENSRGSVSNEKKRKKHIAITKKKTKAHRTIKYQK